MKPYMVEYRQFKKEQQRNQQEAIRTGKIDIEKEIPNKKPSINIFGTTKKKKRK